MKTSKPCPVKKLQNTVITASTPANETNSNRYKFTMYPTLTSRTPHTTQLTEKLWSLQPNKK